MRTAYVLLRFPSPTETFIFREVMDLRRFGLPVDVFTLYGPSAGRLSSEMSAESGTVHRLGLRSAPAILQAIGPWWRRNPPAVGEILRAARHQRWRDAEKSGENLLALLLSFELARRIEAARIEHIHAPWASGCASAAWAASKLTGIPFSFTARAWDIHPPDGLLERKVQGAALVRAETAAAARHLEAVCGGRQEHVHVTYNGLPLRPAGTAPVAMRPPFRLLAVGRFVPKKGFGQLLRAVALLVEAGVDVRLTLVGDGVLRLPLRLLAARLGITDRVAFPGFVPHDTVGDLFLASDVFVMPSVIAPSGDRDGLPTVILEAMAHAVPVVATAVSGIPEVIEDGITGVLVRERDPQGIADAVRRLVSDREEAVAMAARGRERVSRHFDAERNHRAVLDLYRRITLEDAAQE
jgi:glycosyltransferase involved in cell wall biosynthesis